MAKLLAILLYSLQLCGLILHLGLVHADNTPLNPSKIKSNMLRMKKISNKSDLREQKLEISKMFTETKSFLTAPKPVYGRINPLDPQYKDRPIFEVYVRNKKGGIWLRLKDVACKPEMVVNIALLAEGGSIAEESRESLEKNIHSELFGLGMGGDKILHSEVVSVIPQYRKLKLRDMLVGYRQIVTQDNSILASDDSSCIWALNQAPYSSMNHIPTFPSTFILSADVIDEYVDASPRSNGAVTQVDSIEDMTSKIDEFCSAISKQRSKTKGKASKSSPINLYICSDGSATRYSDHIGRYFASAGLVLAATDSSDNIESMLNIQAKADGSVIMNPFDAELIGGLLALGVFIRLSQHKSLKTAPLTSTFLSDSRTLVRVFRQLLESSSSSQGSSLSEDKALRDYAFEMCKELDDKYSLRNDFQQDKIKFRWTAGHPEKRCESVDE
jgi:hypothetical protein